MVWFQCEDCGDNSKKPKFPNYFRTCSASKVLFYHTFIYSLFLQNKKHLILLYLMCIAVVLHWLWPNIWPTHRSATHAMYHRIGMYDPHSHNLLIILFVFWLCCISGLPLSSEMSILVFFRYKKCSWFSCSLMRLRLPCSYSLLELAYCFEFIALLGLWYHQCFSSNSYVM